MFKREEVLKILHQAHQIDKNCEMFGSSRHRYVLNPPIRKSFVQGVEQKYGFKLPEDYFQFITEVGDGGAGLDYGIYPFTEFLMKGESPGIEKFREAYRRSLSNPFTPRQMKLEEVEEYAIVTKEFYQKNPDKYFIYEKFDDEDSCDENGFFIPDKDLCDTDGFFVLGTHGCQWDFGIVITGEMRGQIFDTDNEGGYGFVAHNFSEFYQEWLNWLSDKEQFQKDLEKWKKILKREI